MVAALSLPFLAVVLGEPWPIVVFGVGAAAAVVLLHRPNIGRLARAPRPLPAPPREVVS